jgi:hypothetical protein
MIRNLSLKFLVVLPIMCSLVIAQDADPIEAARQAKLAAEKAAADAQAATGAAIEAAASRAAAEAREKVIAGREAEKARKLAEKEAAENAEIDAAAEAAALEARRKLAAELGLELEEVPDSSISAELIDPSSEDQDSTVAKSNPLQGFNFGFASSVGIASGDAFSNTPLGGTVVITTPYGSKLGPLDLTLSVGFGSYTGTYEDELNNVEFNPVFAGIGANGILAKLVFSETHVGLVGEGIGIRQFAGVTLERLIKNSLNLPFNILIGGEGFISTNMTGGDNTSGWGGLGVRLDISI